MDGQKPNDPPPPEILREYKQQRRRERWSAFLTPIFTLGSLVVSIGVMMAIIRSCEQHFPQNPLSPGGAWRSPAERAAPQSPPPEGMTPAR